MTLMRGVALAAALGALLIVAGVAGLAGPWWALVVSGVLLLTGVTVLLHDDGKSP